MPIKLQQIYNSLKNYSPILFSQNEENKTLIDAEILDDNIDNIVL